MHIKHTARASPTTSRVVPSCSGSRKSCDCAAADHPRVPTGNQRAQEEAAEGSLGRSEGPAHDQVGGE